MLEIGEIKRYIDEDRVSKKKQQAKTGLRYYEQENDIKDYRIFYYNTDGKLVEDKNSLQIRAASGFFGELIDQKAQFSLSTDDYIVDSDIPELKDELDNYFDDEFKTQLKEVVRYGGIEGFSYLYTYQNEYDRKAFVFAEGLTIVEVSSKYASDKQDHVIYYYKDKQKTIGEEKDKDILKIQVWDKDFVYYYVEIDSTITPDTEYELNPRPHILYTTDKGKQFYDTFGFVPFFRFDNNLKQVSDLKPVKDYIDDYDLMNYGLGDNIVKLSDGYICVKGFQGDNLDELLTNMRNKKGIGVGDGGEVDIKTVAIPTEARLTKMNQDEKDIYRFGMGLNTTALGDGQYSNNVNIKTRYSLLDMKCEKVADNLKVLLKKIVKVVLDEINEKNQTGYTLKDVYFNIDKRETITNETDNAQIELTKAQTEQAKITTLLNIATKLGDELLMQNICDVLDINYEDIKDKLPQTEQPDLDKASEDLLNSEEDPIEEEQEEAPIE